MMADLTQARFSSNPLLVLAVVTSAGITLSHYFKPQWKFVVALSMALSRESSPASFV
jgi:hypothetical protein